MCGNWLLLPGSQSSSSLLRETDSFSTFVIVFVDCMGQVALVILFFSWLALNEYAYVRMYKITLLFILFRWSQGIHAMP